MIQRPALHLIRPAALLVLAVVGVGCSRSNDSGGDGHPALSGSPHVQVVAEGLASPLGLAELPDGTILVAEEGTGGGDTSAGVSVITPDGRVGRVVSGLPSGRDSGDLSGAPLAGVSPDGTTAFTGHFGSDGVLTFEIPSDGLAPVAKRDVLGPGDLVATMTPLNEVRLTNPFDIAFDSDGRPVVSDASQNGVATINADGTARFIHRFANLRDPANETLEIDAVPTGISTFGDEYLVTLTGGCPFPEGSGALVAIDGERGERTVVDGLNMPIDVEVDVDGSVWLLEFARFDVGASCFTGEGYRPGTGRLSLVIDGAARPVLDGLDFPGAILVAGDGSVYVSEVFGGRVLRLSWDGEAPGDGDAIDADSARRFRDVGAASGLDFLHGAFLSEPVDDPVAMMGGGLCWLDYDGDGWLDLYLVNSHSESEADAWVAQGGLPSNALFRNLGGEFADTSETSRTGLSIRGNGCVAADFDDDGWVDIYVTADGHNQLLHNMGDETFTVVESPGGPDGGEWSTAAAVADVDQDGDLDLFVGAYIDLDRKISRPSGAFPQDHPGLRNHLYLNTGDGLSFVEAGNVGLDREARTLGALFSDVDADGDLDLYVANDGEPNRLYRNDSSAGQVVFVDTTEDAGSGDPGSGMGIAGGDYDLDGRLDLFVSNWEAELDALYRNETPVGASIQFGYETYRIGLAGLGNNTTGWGTAWVDYDLDTDLDLLVARGRVPVTDLDSDPELTRLYMNRTADGQPGQFLDGTDQAGLAGVGPLLARGSAGADYDNDGDIDFAIGTIDGPPVLLRNEGSGGNWIVVDGGETEPGTIVRVVLGDGTTLIRELHLGSSYLASEDPRFHFGLGDQNTPVEVIISRPRQPDVTYADVPVNQYFVTDQ